MAFPDASIEAGEVTLRVINRRAASTQARQLLPQHRT